MGYEAVSLLVAARLSRHNDERDERDDRSWEELKRRVAEILAEYPDIDPFMP